VGLWFMQRVPMQVDPNFKKMLEKMKHEFCLKESRDVSLREFSRILCDDHSFFELKTKDQGDETLNKLMEKLKNG
jgi:hypothetical protein